MKAYLCKTTWREWDSFLEIFTIENAERIIWADSKIEAIYQATIDFIKQYNKIEP